MSWCVKYLKEACDSFTSCQDTRQTSFIKLSLLHDSLEESEASNQQTKLSIPLKNIKTR